MRLSLIALLALLAQILLGFQGAAPAAATPALNSVFFSDDFEAATLGSSWTTSVTGVGTLEVTTAYPHYGTRSAVLGQNAYGGANVALILALDLTGQQDVYLDFWARATGSYHQGTSRTVWASDNGGISWKQIFDMSGVSYSYSHYVLDIANLATTNGLSLNSQFRINFNYADAYVVNWGQGGDGLVIDDVRVAQRGQMIASFPLGPETFESGDVQQGMYPQSAGNGVAEVNTGYPHGGTKSVFLGQNVYGGANASLIVALDLTGQQDVYLDFWARATGSYHQGTSRTVLASDNGGLSWKQILDVSGVSLSYSHYVLDLANAAATNGLTLNNQFRIVFYYNDTYITSFGQAGDGFVIDDVRVAQRGQMIASFPLGPETFESGDVQQGLYPQSAGNGIAKVGTDYPHSGTHSIFLGQNIYGGANASLIVAVDLTGQSDVLIDFWARSTGSYHQGTYRTVSISSDGGTTWKQILDISGVSQSFTHYVLNLASVAAANGLTLNNQFRISFDYNDTYVTSFGQAGDGLVIDDIKLVRTSLSGKVYNEAATAGSEVAGAYVEVCSASNTCQMITTGSDGSYAFGDLASGSYTLRALPPANNTHMIGTLGPVTLTSNGPLANQNILLPKAAGLPTGTTVTPVVATIGGVPSVFWRTAVTISQKGCTGGTATYNVTSGGATVRSGSLAESPAGTYSAQIAPLFPLHGTAQIEVNITCTTGPQPPIVFNIWIDPSGLVVDTNGKPISGATVSLYRSDATSLADATASSFVAVPTGSGVMSPANRVNPMTSDSNGAFGWDVIAGYYKVRAEKAGCSIPGGSQAYNETAVLSIPPPVTDLRVVLYCGETQQFSVYLPLIRR